MFPALSPSFDTGQCPLRSIPLNFLFISHAYLENI
jgi:hypothetical protein